MAAKILLVPMENEGADIASASTWPKGSVIASQYAYKTQFFGITHPSQPNYLCLVAGSNCGIIDDSLQQSLTQPTIFDQLTARGVSWKVYAEGMNEAAISTPVTLNGGDIYQPRHNIISAFAAYSPSHPKVVNAGSTSAIGTATWPTLVNDLNSATPPDFIYFAPTPANQGHTGWPTSGPWAGSTSDSDDFLAKFTSVVQGTAWYRAGGTIIFIWDEGVTSGSGFASISPGGGPTNLVVVSNTATGVGGVAGPMNAFGMLGDLQDVYGITTALGSSQGDFGTVAPLFGIAPVPPVPNAPSSFAATVASATSVALSWLPATVPAGGAPVTGYQVYNAANTLLRTVTTTSTTFTGLTPSTAYTYYVKATNSSGNSSATPTRSVTTAAAPVAADPVIAAIGTAATSNATSSPFVVPASAAVGSLLLLIVIGGNNALTGPSGWTQRSSGITPTPPNQVSTYVYSKIAVQADLGSTVTVTSAASNRRIGLVLAVNNATDLDVTATLADETTSVTSRVAASAVTTVRDLPILIATDRASSTVVPSSTWTWPSGYTGIFAGRTAAAVNAGDVSLGIATGTALNAGLTAGGGNYVAENALSRSVSTLITVRAGGAPPTYPQLDFYNAATDNWERANLIGVGVGGSLVGVTLPDFGISAAASAQFSADFNTGTIPSFFTVQTGAAVSASNAYEGAFGVVLTPTASASVASLTIGTTSMVQGKTWAAFSMRFKLLSLPGATEAFMNLFEIANAVPASPKGQFTVYWNKRVLECDFNTTDAVSLGLAADTTSWHLIECRVNFAGTSYTAQVRIDGGAPIVMTSAANKTPSTVTQVWIGYPNVALDYTKALDMIQGGTYDSDPGWVGYS